MKNWKRKEQDVTDWLNMRLWPAVRRSRALRGEAVEDIEWGPISVELKTRNGPPPKYLTSWVEQATINAGTRVPMVIVHYERMRMGEQLCVLTLDALVSLLQRVRKEAGNDSDQVQGHTGDGGGG